MFPPALLNPRERGLSGRNVKSGHYSPSALTFYPKVKDVHALVGDFFAVFYIFL